MPWLLPSSEQHCLGGGFCECPARDSAFVSWYRKQLFHNVTRRFDTDIMQKTCQWRDQDRVNAPRSSKPTSLRAFLIFSSQLFFDLPRASLPRDSPTKICRQINLLPPKSNYNAQPLSFYCSNGAEGIGKSYGSSWWCPAIITCSLIRPSYGPILSQALCLQVLVIYVFPSKWQTASHKRIGVSASYSPTFSFPKANRMRTASVLNKNRSHKPLQTLNQQYDETIMNIMPLETVSW